MLVGLHIFHIWVTNGAIEPVGGIIRYSPIYSSGMQQVGDDLIEEGKKGTFFLF